MSKWTPYLGHSQLLSQKDLDQGDTSQRIGTFVVLQNILQNKSYYREGEWLQDGFMRDLCRLYAGNGRYRRSSDPSQAGYDPRRLSRDQKSILMLAMAIMGLECHLWRAFTAQILRFGFHQNDKKWDSQEFNFPDFMSPNEISVFVRGMGLWFLYPLLLVLDLGFLLDLHFRKKNTWDYDNMLCQQLMYANKKYKTPFGALAWRLYIKTDFQLRIKNYHTYPNGIPPLWDLYEEAIWRCL